MDNAWEYEIKIEGDLSDGWSDWFEGLVIRRGRDHQTTLTGPLPDQAALYGVLNKIHNMNLTLISVVRLERCE